MAIRSQPLAMGLKPITGLADGIEPEDAVNKGQLDAAIAGAVPAGSITTEKLADGSVTLAKFDPADFASQAEAEAGTNNTKLVTPLRVAQYAAAHPPTIPPQKLVNVYHARYTATTGLTALFQNTTGTPTSTQGTEIISVSVTTTTATQVVDFSFQAWGASSPTVFVGAGVFVGGTCIAAVNAPFSGQIYIANRYEPGAAGTYTFTVRVGPNTTATIQLNPTMGSASSCSFKAQVIEP